MGKKLVLCKNSSKLATSRKVQAFFGSMGDTYKGSRNFRNCKGVQDTFSKKSNTRERVPQTPHMCQEQADLIQFEIENMLKRGAIQQTAHQAGEFLSNIFLVGKRDGGNRPVANLRYLRNFRFYFKPGEDHVESGSGNRVP